MAGFTAAAVTSLDYDFTGVVVPPGAEPITDKGVVAEPTDAAFNAFFTGMAEFRQALVDGSADPTEDQIAKIRSLVTEFCAGTPSAEVLAALPPRYLQAFTRWLSETLGGADPKD